MDKESDSSGKPKYTDPTSPYFLSEQAHSGNSLTRNSFKGDNYATWEQSAIMSLKYLNKLDFIDGRIEKPDNDSPDFPSLKIVNAMLCSWILNSLDPPVRATVSRLITDAKVMWDPLKTHPIFYS